MAERDLSLRVTADATQAKAELEALQKAEQGLVTSAESATVATAGSASALRDQGDAAGESAGQVGESRDALSDLGSSATVAGLAQQRLSDSIKGSTGAIVTQVTATKTSTVATQADTVAETQQTVATKGSTVAALADAGAETVQAAATRSSTSSVMANALAMTGSTTATRGATAANAGYTASAGLMGMGARAAGAAIAGKELSVARLATGLVKLAAPVLGVVTVIALLPAVIKLVVEKVSDWSTKIGENIVGLDLQAGVARKAGESTQDYQKRVNEAADANEDLERALNASRKGLIGVTADSEKLRAEGILLAEGLHQGTQSAEKLAFAYKELGLKMVESMKFEDAQLGITNFIAQYDRELKKGENSARRFTDTNKDFVLARMEAYEDEGRAIPAALQAIADKYDIVTTAQKESLSAAQAQLEAWSALTPKARELVAESEKFLAMGIRTGEAFIAPKIHVESLLESIKKLEVEGTQSFKATLDAMGGSVDAFTTKAGFANAAIDALYSGDDETFTPGRTYTPPPPE